MNLISVAFVSEPPNIRSRHTKLELKVHRWKPLDDHNSAAEDSAMGATLFKPTYLSIVCIVCTVILNLVP